MMRMVLVVAVCVLSSACDRRESVRGDGGRSGDDARQAGQNAAAETPPVATVTLQGVNGDAIRGTARLTQEPNAVRVVATVSGAAPGKHGIHIHETPDCSNPAAKSMGAHFTPGAEPHALPHEGKPSEHHLGDLGSIDVGADGRGTLDLVVDGATLTSDPTRSFANRALIVHAAEDKGRAAQPAGDSGDPIACGVITVATR